MPETTFEYRIPYQKHQITWLRHYVNDTRLSSHEVNLILSIELVDNQLCIVCKLFHSYRVLQVWVVRESSFFLSWNLNSVFLQVGLEIFIGAFRLMYITPPTLFSKFLRSALTPRRRYETTPESHFARCPFEALIHSGFEKVRSLTQVSLMRANERSPISWWHA